AVLHSTPEMTDRAFQGLQPQCQRPTPVRTTCGWRESRTKARDDDSLPQVLLRKRRDTRSISSARAHRLVRTSIASQGYRAVQAAGVFVQPSRYAGRTSE